MAFFDLLKCECVVVSESLSVSLSARTAGGVLRGDGDVTAVEDGGPAVEGVRFEGNVVASAGVLVNIHFRLVGCDGRVYTRDSVAGSLV